MISAVIGNQVLPPSGSYLVSIPQVAGANITTGSVVLTWAATANATGYIIFGRTQGKEQTLFTLGSGASTVTDIGVYSPSGAYAANYAPIDPLTYVYTYVRDVGTMVDESGPSPLSAASSSSYVRTLTRNPLTDGFYASSNAYTGNLSASSSNGSTPITGAVFQGSLTILTLAGSAPISSGPWWVPGMSMVFSASDTTYTPYPFSLPAPLGTPVAPNQPVNGGLGSGLAAGTYSYKVAAIRGAVAGLTSPATTIASAISPSLVLPSANSINVSWTGVSGATGYVLYRYNGTNYQIAATINGSATSFVDVGAGTTVVTPPTVDDTGVTYGSPVVGYPLSWENPPATHCGRIMIIPQVLPANTKVNLLPGTPIASFSLAASTITSIAPTFTGVDQDAVYISGPSTLTKNQLGGRTYYHDAMGIFTNPAWINCYSKVSVNGVSFSDVPNNNYYTYWNIYRAGDTGTAFSFVASVPIQTTVFNDVVGTEGLGYTLPTEYPDADTGGTVIFAPPPADLIGVTAYNGMLMGISGNSVRWTPIGMPDAWPLIYSQSFPFPPQCVISHSGGAWIFCEDAIYRMDGFTPGGMGVQKTRCDGCIGPLTPKVIGSVIVYLAKRGIMVINGMDATCATERVIPYRLLTQPSYYLGGVSQQKFWWNTTDHMSSYGALLDIGMNPIPAADTFGVVTAKDKPINGVIWEARSFVWQNKYYLYFSNVPTTEFAGNPTWCLDFGTLQQLYQIPNHPVTTLGFKPTDVHVSSTGECYTLLGIDATNDPENQARLAMAEAQFNTALALVNPSYTASQAIYRFNPTFGLNVPMRFRTSENTANSPQTRKRWREVRMNGIGTCQVRVFIDGVLWTLANGQTATTVTLSESPIHPSRILLPVGSWGYSCSVEVCGDITVRFIEFGYDPMTGED